MSSMQSSVPSHLRKYVVEQNYSRYTAEDQAVWRFIMRQLKDFLSTHAHECYVDGLKKTGIDIDRIPDIEVMNKKLGEFGWAAVPVSGFIPPAAFMEFQSLGILPIASDMRSIDHLTYTPAPDIVHEAAGHAPILINTEYAAYLKEYADVARHAILTKEDLAQYEAIRVLSDVKENPDSTKDDIRKAEDTLAEVNRTVTLSEAGWLSRMNWWTAEYGLIGSMEKPKIFGAGLLSSVGESRHSLSTKVKKIPLSIDCINFGYDITEPQPQLFVTPDFAHLSSVLRELAEKMAFRVGGVTGLKRAKDARSVTTVVLDTGLQISGVLADFAAEGEQVQFLKFSGPVQLCVKGRQIPGHGPDYHANGYSTPLGPILTRSENDIKFMSGIELTKSTKQVGKNRPSAHQVASGLIETFDDCTVRWGDRVLYQADWGPFDLAIGESVVSVFGGPADRAAYGDLDDFVAARVPVRQPSHERQVQFQFFTDIRRSRDDKASRWQELCSSYLSRHSKNWLMGVELLEIYYLKDIRAHAETAEKLEKHLLQMAENHPARESILDGIKLKDVLL